MALTRDDLQAIGTAIRPIMKEEVSGAETRLHEELRSAVSGLRQEVQSVVSASEKRLIAAMDERFTQQAAYLSRAIADTVKLLSETYATKEKVEELENEVDDLAKRLKALESRSSITA